MFRCSHCGRLVYEEDICVTTNDPSPRGISLPEGSYSYHSCPHCGRDIADDDKFSLIDKIDIEEVNDTEITLTLDGKGISVYITDEGEIKTERLNPAYYRKTK